MHGDRLGPPRLDTAEFFKRSVIVLFVALVPVLIWFLFDVVLIAIGAILIAVLLRLIAEPIAQWARLPQGVALLLSGIITVGALAGAAYLFGTQIDTEFKDVISRAGSAMTAITGQLHNSQMGRLVLSRMQGGSFSIPTFMSRIFSVSTSFLEALVVTVVGGFYLAAQPDLYRKGLAKLFPRQWRASANETIDDIGQGLRLWLIGELIQMVLIGLLSTAAVWLIGLPSPLALGVIAGVAEFVPYLGPILAAIPAILVATTQGTDAMLWTVFAYVLIHQIEGNLVAPLIQRRMVFIPPAVMLLGIVMVLFVFGGVAVIFAAPIAVIVFIAIQKLYIRDSLGESTVLPGESA